MIFVNFLVKATCSNKIYSSYTDTQTIWWETNYVLCTHHRRHDDLFTTCIWWYARVVVVVEVVVLCIPPLTYIYIYLQPASAAAGLVASNKTRGRRLWPQLQQWPQPRVEVSVVALLLDKTTKRGEGILDSFFFFFHQEGSPCMYVSSVTLPCSSF